MLPEDQEFQQALIPGILSDRKNCIVYYAHILAVFMTLILILVITIVTAATVSQVHQTVGATHELINDMNELLPQARTALKIKNVLCKDVNFTTFHPKYAKVVCG
tara:strand:- start:1068 stop:1382 length:315 start_codon:yes stop_codon:yes gene_type:complete